MLAKEKDISMYMDIAYRVSQRSYAKRLKVGCVIEKDHSIVSFGWNGMPVGYDNCCEHIDANGNEVTNVEVQHAELNAIGKAAKAGISTNNATLYITHSPCIECAKIILVSGIKAVYFKEVYRDDYGIDFLKTNGVYVEQVK
jgi:dCMP deaminase